jgi:hypothetical protein
MELTAAILLVGALGVFPVIALVVQVYRDLRGKKRNLAMRCYACESSGYLFPVPHYKGDTFLYCLLCVKSQHKSQRFFAWAAIGGIAVALAGWVILSRG